MIEILIYNIIPVFAVMALGFLLGQINFVSNTEATTLNRIAFLILQPALIFPLVANANFNEFYVESIALYGLAQAIIFLVSFYIGFFIFSCPLIESWLIAMATVFVNSLLYIFPISKLIYGIEGNIPVTAIVVWDATFTFAFFIITTDLLANKKVSFNKLDNNSDGKISISEYLDNPNQEFDTLDSNRDGFLTKDELNSKESSDPHAHH